jgi:sulfite exporter TauE/SafE
MISSFCGGNYVIFSGSRELFQFFSGYYFSFLVLGIWESLEALNVVRSKWLQRTLQWVVIGYLSFMLPMAIVYAIYAPARVAVASIMCGFALILAFILAFEIVPKYYRYSGQKEA